MKPLLQSIDHINLVVKDLEKVKQFFLSLGFLVSDQSRLHGEWISRIAGLENVDAHYVKLNLPGDTHSLELIQFKNPPSPVVSCHNQANTPGFRHLAFRVNDIERVVAFLREHNINPLSSIQEYAPTKKKLVYFKGPEGILLELAQYDDQ